MNQMTQLMQPFDATQYNPAQGGGGFPIGKHPVVIKDSEIKGTSKNDGSGMAVLDLEIIDGPHKGTTGEYRLNLYNINPEAARIAHSQLSAICHVVQTYKISDLRELYGKAFIIEVGLQKSQEAAEKGYTEIKKVFDMNGNEPGKAGGAPATAPAQVAQPAQPAAAAPAWQGGTAAAPAQPQQGQTQWGQPAAAAPAAAAPAGQWGAPAATAAPAGQPGNGTPPWGQPR